MNGRNGAGRLETEGVSPDGRASQGSSTEIPSPWKSQHQTDFPPPRYDHTPDLGNVLINVGGRAPRTEAELSI